MGSLSKDVFERHTSTGSEALSFFKNIKICLDVTKFVLLGSFTLTETICSKMQAKPLPKNEKNTLPVDMRQLNTSLIKLPITAGPGSGFSLHICIRLCSGYSGPWMSKKWRILKVFHFIWLIHVPFVSI